MCVCLFSALSRRVGPLQISIIIIIHTAPDWLPAHTAESFTQRPQLTGPT